MREALPSHVARAFAHLTSLFDLSRLTSQEQVLAAARAAMERYGDEQPRTPMPDIAITPVQLGTMDAEWLCAPGASSDNRLLYLHGGGLICGSLASHRPIAAELARQTGFSVLNINYRIAPEHVFPAAHDDAATAFGWLLEHGPDAAAPAHGIALVADSAGCNLAMNVCARAIVQRGRLPDTLTLLGPCLDNTVNPARPERASDPIINDRTVAPMALYAASTPLDDPRISPLFLPDSILAQFPPVLIQVSAGEFLLPDAQQLSARLTALDRRHVLSLWPTLPHVWHTFLSTLPEARAALAEAGRFIKGDFAPYIPIGICEGP